MTSTETGSPGRTPSVEPTASGFVFESAYRVDGPNYRPGGSWFRGVVHREEAARGLGPTEDVWAAGTFTADLSVGEVLGVTATTDLGLALPGRAVGRCRRPEPGRRAGGPVRRHQRRSRWGPGGRGGPVRRPDPERARPRWPGTRGSVSGRATCSPRTRGCSSAPAGPRRDARCWSEPPAPSPRACWPTPPTSGRWSTTPSTRRSGSCTPWVGTSSRPDDVDLAAELADTVVDVLSAHRAGTRFGIQVDPATGLLRGGASGWALTWMDARIDGRPVTPRAGFPVEVEALWINGLGAAVDLLDAGRPPRRRVGRVTGPGHLVVHEAVSRQRQWACRMWWTTPARRSPTAGRTSCWRPPSPTAR